MTVATKVAIAADSPETVKAGKLIAEQGGNIIDIAVGTALAAAHAEILMCSLGGSAFINIKLPGQEAVIIDGADAMPSQASGLSVEKAAWRKAEIPYGDGISINVGHGSVAIPGMLRALELAWKRYGSLNWAEIMSPALHFAKNGVKANQTLAAWLELAGDAIFYQQKESRQCFFPNEKRIQNQQQFTLPHYYETLKLIEQEGADAFYAGDIADQIVKEMQANEGYISHRDLADYRPTVRKPLTIHSGGYDLALNPPPAIGGAMVGSMVGLYESQLNSNMSEGERVLLKAQAQRMMFSLRHEESEGDWNESRANKILNRDWLLKYQKKVFSPHTMHMSFATADGAVVGITMSNGYGSGVTIPGTGISLNNSLGEPELNPHGFFQIPPEGKFVSNMAPTIAWDDKGDSFSIGSPGASRITTSIFQGWTNLVLEGKGLKDSIRTPRFHVDNVNGVFTLQYERGVDVSLAKNYFELREFPTCDMYFGALNIAGRRSNGELMAASDERRHGATFVS